MKLAALVTRSIRGNGAATVMLTGIVVEPVAEPVPAIVTEPLHVPAVKLAGFTETETVPGTVPVDGVATSHPVAQFPGATCTEKGRPDWPETVTVWAEGGVSPAW